MALPNRFVKAAKVAASVVATGASVAAVSSGVAGAIVNSAENLIKNLTSQDPNASAKIDKFRGQLCFPYDLINDNRNYYMNIQFVDYQRRSIFDNPTFPRNGTGIQLPLPSNLVDSTNVDWSQSSEAGAAVGAGIENGIQKKNGSGMNPAKIADIIGGAGAVAIEKGISKAIDSLGGATASAQALQLAGLSQNPFMTMLFKSPQFKDHQFSWKLSPKNAEESNRLINIINALKANMLPSMNPGSGGTFLTYPSMLYISLNPSDVFLYQFKPCVIKTLSVNFAPTGTPSFFKGTNGAPTSVSISLGLIEIEYWLREDIADPTGVLGLRQAAAFQAETPTATNPQSGGR